MSKMVSGKVLTIDDSAYDGMDELVIYGNLRENLWRNPNGTSSGVTVKARVDGGLNISGTSTDENSIYIDIYTLIRSTPYTVTTDKLVSNEGSSAKGCFVIQTYKNDGTRKSFVNFGYSKDTKTVSFTTPSDFDYARLLFYTGGAGNTFDLSNVRVMLNYGNTAAPYCLPGLQGIEEVSVSVSGANIAPNEFRDSAAKVNSGIKAYISPAFEGENVYLPTEFYDDKKYYDVKHISSIATYFRDEDDINLYGVTNASEYMNLFIPSVVRPGNYLYMYLNNLFPGKTRACQIFLEEGTKTYDQRLQEIESIDLQGYGLYALPNGQKDELHIDRYGNVTLIKRVWKDTFSVSQILANPGGSGEFFEEWSTKNFKGGVTSNEGSRSLVLNDFAVNSNPDNVNGMVKVWVYDQTLPSGHNNHAVRFGNGKVMSSSGELKESFVELLGDNVINVYYAMLYEETISLGKIDVPKLQKNERNHVWVNSAISTEIELTYRQWPGVRADGFKVSGKHNFWDFASCVASSDSGKPEKKFVTSTVPYMSGFYDLSKIYGAIAYESRDVSYTFELLGDNMEDLQQQKTNLLDWLGLVHDEPIYDDTQPNYHYVGSFYEADWEEDETGESGTLTVTFKCQPFLISDRATEESLSVGTHAVVNPGQQVSVFAKANSGSATVKINGVTQAVTTTEQRLTAQLQPGENEVVVTSNSVTLRYYERHL